MNPDPSSESVLGSVVRTFKPTRVNIVAGSIVGLLLLAAGSALIARAQALPPDGAMFLSVLGAACITGGLVLLAFTIQLAYTRVDLCTGGFRYYTSGGPDDVTWDEVDLIQLHIAAPKSDGAHVDPSVTVLTEQGKAYHFTANHVTKMAAFVKAVEGLTSDYDNLWEVTNKASKRRLAVVMIVTGLFCLVMAPVMFLDITRAEQNAGEDPVRLPSVVFLLYQLGGKWFAAFAVFFFGLAALFWGVVVHGQTKSPIPRHQKTKRSGHTTEGAPSASSEWPPR